ncbi:MFS transporter [Leifsonia xyli subsp. xyli]|uniref:Sugar transporter n=3 Tax=Leifsonia xyli TaxID=1575 RepID=Q6AEA2_LEIXX|nr:sugar transporter [Leifsonia xyli subsp. xyli str. CTCB07]ODA89918.1 MFS transporter [Leifsonia xyli subsp. xyli]
MLALGVLGQASSTVFVSTPAFLIPVLHSESGLSLAQAGILASTPTIGLVLALIAWGALSDRIGERWVIAVGLALTALAALGAMSVSLYLAFGALLLIGGMSAASPNAASGRVVIGWFPKERRGLAMGIRQMCQPLGVAVAAISVPSLAAGGGIALALVVPAALCGVSAVLCALAIVDPPRVGRGGGDASEAHPQACWRPYRETSLLWRIHGVSMLLVVPQFTVSTFGLVWLVAELGFSSLAAGIVIGVSQFAGAIGRIGVGVLSDRVGSHLRTLRWVPIAAIAAMLLMAVASVFGSVAAAVILIVVAVVTVADNGLAYTAVAEIAGPSWSGRVLGAQNTGQFAAASVVGPVVGAPIGWLGYPLAFAIVALCPAVAAPLVPRDHELMAVSE